MRNLLPRKNQRFVETFLFLRQRAHVRRYFATPQKSQSQIHLSRRQLATGRIESARQIVGRAQIKQKEEKKGETARRVQEEESIQEGGGGDARGEWGGGRRKDEGGSGR